MTENITPTRIIRQPYHHHHNNVINIEQIYLLYNNDNYIEYTLIKILFALLFIIVLQYIL